MPSSSPIKTTQKCGNLIILVGLVVQLSNCHPATTVYLMGCSGLRFPGCKVQEDTAAHGFGLKHLQLVGYTL